MDVEHVLGKFPLRMNALDELRLLSHVEIKKLVNLDLKFIDEIRKFDTDYFLNMATEPPIDRRAGLNFVDDGAISDNVVRRSLRCAVSAFQGEP